MKRRRHFFLMKLAAGAAALLSINLIWAQGYSHARIVRLSFVEGHVTLQRPDVSAWADAPVNTPLQEGFRLSTGENSFAEVEFENCGTARLGQVSLLDFGELGLTPGGGKVNHLQLEQGYATFHARLEGNEDSFEVTTPAVTVTAQGNALFRVDLDKDVERVEVFRGAVEVAGNLGSWTLEKNMVLELNPGAEEPAHVSDGITKDDWDHWVDERESRLAAAQASPPPNDYSTGPPSLLYGWDDLGQYGTWSYVQGWGYGWTPTLIGAGWAPYSMGQWCWYPGWGWTWIPAEPWGWLPYHYGGWDFVPGVGWAWFPEGFGAWSPAPVAWYSGPGWIGWTPRTHPVHGGVLPNSCGAGGNCGGAVVSLNTFRNGGRVTSTTVLAYNPASGLRIDQPTVQPTTSAMLPGPVAKQPAAYEPKAPGSQGGVAAQANAIGNHKTPETQLTGSGAASLVAPGPRRQSAGVALPNSTIVYDPQGGRYVNKDPGPEPPAGRSDLNAGANATGKAGAPESSTEATRFPAPPADNPGGLKPTSATGSITAGKPGPRMIPSSPRGEATPRGNSASHTSVASSGGSATSGGKAAAPSGSGSSSSHFAGGGGGGGFSGGGSGGGHSGGAAGGGSHH